MFKNYIKQKEVWISGLIGGLIPIIGLLFVQKFPIIFGIIWIPYFPFSILGYFFSLITDNSSLIFELSFVLLVIEYIFIGLFVGFLISRKK